jgi:quercetin dioxygenase-like cupin family protein
MPIRIFHVEDGGVPLPLVAKQARLIVWPGSGAHYASMNHVILEPGEANVPHTHADSEDTIFILEGRASVRDFTHDVTLSAEAGCVVHIPAGIQHALTAETRLESIGGPVPPDLAMLRRTGVLRD